MTIVVGGLQVFIRDDVERFTANFRGVATNVSQQSERMRRAVGGVSDSVDRMNRAAASSSPNAFRALALSALRAEDNVKRLETALLAVSALAGGFAGAFVLRGLAQAADAYTNIQNRLSTITKTEAERVAVNEAIFEIAQRTRTEYGATATLFARIGTATDKLGASTADVLRVVETVQKSFAVAGSTTQEAQSAAIQLSQGLASGKLQGDELKSILENNIPLARLLARELAGGDIGQLRELGEKGALDPKSVFNAILNGSAGIDAAFERTGQTTSQAILKLSNALTAFVGKMDDSIGATAKLAAALGSLADNFAPIASGALLVAAALTSVFLSNKLLSGASAVRGKLTSLMAEQTANLKQLEEQAKATQSAMLRSVFSSEPAQAGGRNARDIAMQQEGRTLRSILRDEAALKNLNEERVRLVNQIASTTANTSQIEERFSKRKLAAEARLAEIVGQRLALEAKATEVRLADAEKTSSQLISLAQREAAERTKINNLYAAEQAAIANKVEQAAAQRASAQGRLNEIVRQSSATGVGLAFQREGASESVASRMIANQNAMAVSQRNVAAETLAASRAAEEFARANSLVSRSLGVARAAGLSLYGFLGGPWGVALNAATVALGIWGYRAEAEAARVRRAQDLIAKALGSAAEQGDVVAKQSVYDRQKDELIEDIKSLTEQAARARAELAGAATSGLGMTLFLPGQRFAELQAKFPGLVSAFESGKISVNQFKTALTELGVPAPILEKINSEITGLSKPVEQAQAAIEALKKQLADLDGQVIKINVDIVQRRIDNAFLDAQKISQADMDRESRAQQAFSSISQNATAELILRQRLAKARGDEAEKVRELAQEIVRETNISYDAAVKQAQAEVAAAKGKKDSAKASREAAAEQKRLDKAYKDSLDTLREKAAEARLEVESFRESKQSQYEAKILLEEYNKLAEKGVAITKEKALALQQQAAATAKDMVAADALQKAKSAADDIRSTLGSTTGGFFNDLANGVSTVEALRNAFVSLRTAILNALANRFIASILGPQGSPLSILGSVTGSVPNNYSSGGNVRGPGTSRSDSIPAMLSDGEFVVNAQSARRHSRLLEAINSGRAPRFASGGWADQGARALSGRHDTPMVRALDRYGRDGSAGRVSVVNHNDFRGVDGAVVARIQMQQDAQRRQIETIAKAPAARKRGMS